MAAAFAREGGYGAPASVIHIDSSHPDHAIIVPDAALLFTADFRRAGPDLILIGHDGRHHVIPGYFAAEHRQALAAPNGASLLPDLVDLLAGSPAPNEYAQAGAATAANPVGEVEKVVGDVTVVRNGVAVALNVGDQVYKSDIVQTGADSQVGISFPDGTALNLVANTRMALNDFNYDENANSGNGALLSLVEGSFSFVAGKVAHTGDMKIDTPVATMGIRGTTGWVQQVATITANAGTNTYTFAVVPDYGTNQSGQYDLIDRQGNVLATVSQPGFVTAINPQGIGVAPLVTVAPVTTQQAQFETNVIQQVFQTLTAPTNPANPNNPNNNPNPQSTPNSTGSSTSTSDQPGNSPPKPPPPPPPPPVVPLGNSQETAPVVVIQPIYILPPPPPEPLTNVSWIGGSGPWTNPYHWDDNGFIPGAAASVTIDTGTPLSVTVVTVDDQEYAAALTLGASNTLQIVNNPSNTSNPNSTPILSSLTITGAVNAAGLIVVNSNVADATLTLSGPVTVAATGEIEATGSAAVINFLGDIITNLGMIVSSDSGTITFSPLTVTVPSATSPTGTTTETIGPTIYNGGIIEATNGGTNGGIITFTDAIINNFDTVPGSPGGTGTPPTPPTPPTTYFGTIEATGAGSVVQFVDTYLQGGTLATGSLTSNANGEIEIVATTGANISIFDGSTDTVTVNGYVQVDDGANLALLGTFDNTGTIAVGAVTGADLVIDGTVTLDGSGAVVLDSSGSALVGAANTGDTLVNAGNVISGTGTIEGLVIENQSGTIEAINGGTLTLDGDAIANAGLMAGSGGGSTLIFFGGTDVNTGSTIAEQQGTVVFLFASALNEAAGTMTATSGGTLQFEASALTNDGAITADGGSVIIDNTQLQNLGQIVAQNTGTVTLADATNSSLFTFANSGTVEAGSGGTLNIIDAALSNALGTANTGVVEALSGGQIVLENGVILAGSVTIASGATLATVVGSSNEIDTANGQDNLNVVTLSNAGTIAISDNSSLMLASPDAISNAGTIQLNSTGDATTLYIAQPFAGINGGGQITLTNNADNVIAATTSGEQLTNFDNTISGAGTIGAGGMALVNRGTIDADDSVPLILDPTSLTNSGTLEATDGATLDIGNITVNNSGGTISLSGTGSTVNLSAVTITGGAINGAGGTTLLISTTSTISGVSLNNGGVTVNADQTLTLDNDTVSGTAFTDIASGAVLSVDAGDTLTLDDVTVTGGTLDVAAGATLDLVNTQLFGVALSDLGALNVSGTSSIDQFKIIGGHTTVLTGQTLVLDNALLSGTVTNDGTLQVDSGATSAFAGAAITGGAVSDAGTIEVMGTSSINDANITITGAGTIETTTGALTIDPGSINNAGLLEANGSTLTIDGTPVTNTGELLATDDSTLVLNGLTVTNYTVQGATTANGTVAADSGSTLDLQGATISGGIVNVHGVLDSTGTSTIDGAAITASGTLEATSGTLTIASGSTGNSGELLATGGATLEIENGTFTNTGTIQAAAGSQVDLANATVSGGTLTSASGGTIDLSGGTISGATIDNSGALNVTGSGTIENTTITGGQLTIESGVTATLDDVTLNNVAVTVDGGTNVSIQIDAGDTLTWAGASSFGGPGAIVIDNNGHIIHTGTLSIGFPQVTFEGSGTVTENGGNTGTEPQILINAGNTFDGYGQFGNGNGTSLTLTNEAAGTFDADVSAHNLILDTGNSITNAGTFEATAGATLEIESTVPGDTTVVNNAGGRVNAEANSEVLLSNATVSGGTVSAAATGIIVGSGTSAIDNAIINNAGTLETAGTFTLDNDTVNGGIITGTGTPGTGTPGTLNIDSGDTLTLNGVTVRGGGDGGTGTVDNSGTITLENMLTISGANFTLALNNDGSEGTGTVALNGATIEASTAGATLENNGNTISGAGQIGNGNGDLTLDNNAGMIEASGSTLTIETGNTVTNAAYGTLEAASGATLQIDDNVSNSGAIEAAGGTADINGAVSGTGSGLIEGGGTLVVKASGSLASTGGDAIDASSSGADGDISITANGTVTGADNGIDAIQNGSGNVSIGGSGNITGQSGAGILAEQSASGLGGVSVSENGTVTGTGSSNDGILAEILNTADSANVTVSQAASVTGGQTGIQALTDGTGNVTVTTTADATITGTTLYGIQAKSVGTGSVLVTTVAGDTIDSAGTGILANNQATAISQSADSTITVNAYGTINSGTTLNNSGSRPAGILAVYNGASTGTGTPNANVFGSVFVNNYANITAAGGDGIRAADYGVGNITVTDGTLNDVSGGTGTVIDAPVQYGIDAFTYFTGNISVSTAAGDSIVSGSTGISAVNEATAISASADSTITVTAYGTINSGSNLDTGGQAPGGIQAGYNDGSPLANTNVSGNVLVNDYANITAAAGWGIDAFNYGNGNVTVNDYASTVTAAQTGIAAYQDGGGTGNVTVTAAADAAIIGTTGYGIQAYSTGTGNISVTTAANDSINSGSSGILAVNAATAISASADSTITVTAYGTINSGSNLDTGGQAPGGIQAGYNDGSPLANTNVSGNVLVNDYANITAAAGWGIDAFNYGNGNVTVNDYASTVTAAQTGIAAYQDGGGTGNVTVTAAADAAIIGTTGYGIQAYSTGTGNISVTTAANDSINSGSSGILAVNAATAISASADSTITVTAYGTINSGSNLDTGGQAPGGIQAGYNDGSPLANTNVSGNVLVNDYANITAAAGWGIDAFNYGNGNVTVNDYASTVTAAQTGIAAYQDGGGTGNVTVTIDSGATVTGDVFAEITGTGTVDITNYGTITQNDGTAIALSLAAVDTATIDNYGTISGSVDLTGSASIDNEAGGIIESQSGTAVLAGTIGNAGTFQALNSGTLEIENSTVANTGNSWSIQAGANSEVELLDATLNGGGTLGTISTAATGIIVGNGTSAIDNATINNLGALETGGTFTLDGDTINGGILTATGVGQDIYNVDQNATLTLNGITALGANAVGTVDNAGTIMLDNALTISGASFTLALDGAGVVALNGATVEGSGATQALLVDGNTVVGAGTIQDLAITTENGGAIGAEHSDTLTIQDVSIVNDSGGSIYTTASGTVTIQDAGITNASGGTIESSGSGTIDIDSAIVTNAAGGTIVAGATTEPFGSGAIDFSDGSIDNSGTISGNDTGTISFDGYGVTNESGATIEALDSSTITFTDAGITNDTGATIESDGTGASLVFLDDEVINLGSISADGTVSFDDVTVTNTDGTITVAAESALDLSGATIIGGTITDNGTIDVSGNSTINDGADLNGGGVTLASGVTLTLDNDTVTGTTFTDTASGAVLSVDGGDTLTVSGATISGGTITDDGTIDVSGDSTINGGADLNGGGVTLASGVTLTLDNDTVTGTTFTDTASGAVLSVDGSDTLTVSGVTISGGTITDDGTIDVSGDSTINGGASLNGGGVTIGANTTLTLDNDTVTGTTFTDTASGAVLSVDGSDTLTVSGVTISGGTVTDNGTIDVTGASTIGGADLNDGGVTVASGVTLTLDNDTVTGTTFTDTASGAILSIDPTDTLTLSGVTINGGTINDGTGSTLATAGTIVVSGNSEIENANLNNGGVSIAAGVTLTLDGTTVTGSTITSLSTATTTGIVNVDSSQTLTLTGANTVTGGALAIALGSAQAAAGNSSVSFSTVQIGDLYPGANPSVTLTIQASSGSFAAISGSGLTVTQSGDEVTIAGDLTDINNALNNGLTYTPAAGVISNTLTLSVTDGSGDTAFRTISINTSNPATPTTTNLSASGEITNAGLIDVTGTATLSSDALFNNGGTVEISGLLTLDDSKIFGGTITDNSTVEIAGFSAFTANAHLNIGAGDQVTIDPTATLGLSGATVTGSTGATINNGGTVDVTGSSTINGVSLDNGGVTLANNVTLTLDGDTVTGTTFTDTASGAVLAVNAHDTLTLSGVTINGGTVNDGGTVDITAPSTLDNVKLTGGQVTIDVALPNLTATDQGTSVQFTGSGFDAARVFSPAVVDANGQYAMLFAGQSSGNGTAEIGLATSSDGTNWSISPSSPVITNADSPSWASSSEVPVSLLYSNGTYQLYFNGDGDSFGYATSSDGINWTIGSNPIRSGSPGNGYTLDSVVNVNESGGGEPQYIAYYTYGGVLYSASSNDGVNFSNDTPVNVPVGYDLLATALTTIDGQGALVAAFEDSSGNGYYGITTDGTNFTIEGSVALPAGMTVNSILIENGLIKFYGGISEDGGANTGIELVTAPIPNEQALTLDGATISGSAISGNAGIDVTGSSTIGGNASVTDAQITVENQQTLSFGNATLVDLSVVNDGTVAVNPAVSTQTLTLNSAAFSGGTVTVGSLGVITTTVQDPTGNDNSIDDATINNAGTLEATNGGNVTISADSVKNSGTILAESPADVSLTSTFIDVSVDDSIVNNVGGILETAGLNAFFGLDGTTIEGGTLLTTGGLSGGGAFLVQSDNEPTTSVFDGSSNAVTVNANVYVFGGAQLELKGDIHLDLGEFSHIAVGGVFGSGASSLIIDGAVTLDGGGLLSLNATAGNPVEIIAAPGGGTLDADVGIFGSGTIGQGDGTLTFINEAGGTIGASGGTSVLAFNTGNTVINLGTIEALGGTLEIENSTIDNATSEAVNTGQVVIASGSFLEMDNASILAGSVNINAGGELYTVAGTTSIINNEINTANGQDNLSTPTLTNAGTIIINADSSLALGSPYNIENSGTIELNGSTSPSDQPAILSIDQPFAILDGGGQITLSDHYNNVIGAATSGDQLTNLNNTISGVGEIGYNGLILVNQGTIDADIADAANPLVLSSPSITNTGTLEATAGGALAIDNGVQNTDGTIAASGTDSSIQLTGTVSGGAVTIGASDTLAAYDVAALDDVADVQNTGTIEVYSSSTLTLDGSTVSGGIVQIDDADSTVIGTGTSEIENAIINNAGTLETGGTFTLDGDTVNGGIITGAQSGNSIDIDNGFTTTLNGVTVEGGGGATAVVDNAGNIALENTLTLSSLPGDIADGNTAFTLLLDDNGTVSLNGQLVQGTEPGEILENSGNTISGSGQIGDGTDSNLTLDNASGTIEALGGTLTIDTGNTVTNAGTLEAVSGAVLQIDDSVDNSGTIKAVGAGSTVSLTGGMSNSTGGVIQALDGGTITFDYSHVDNDGPIGAIRAGDGAITFDHSRVDNYAGTSSDGGIGAWDGGTVTFDQSSVDNYGIIDAFVYEGSSGGTVTFDYSYIDNENGGTIAAYAAGSSSNTVTFDHSRVDNDDKILAYGGGTVTFDYSDIDNYAGGNFANGSGIDAGDDGTLTFDHSRVDNYGGIGAGDGGVIGAGGTVTFDHSRVDNDGTIGAFNGSTITFDHSHVDNESYSAIGAYSGSTITFDHSRVDNESYSTIYAVNSSTVTFDDSRVENDGTIAAYGDGAFVELSDATIAGGTLVTNDPAADDGGEIEVLAAGGANTSIFDGSVNTLTIDGYVQVDAGANLQLVGTIDNDGTIAVGAASGTADLVIDGPVTLDGGGTIALDGGSDEITGAGNPNDALTNAGNTISGSGTIEDLAIVNQSGGTIAANGGDALTIQYVSLANAGALDASGGGTLTIQDAGVTNQSGGTIEAQHRGTIDIGTAGGGVIVTNDAEGAIEAIGYGAAVDFTNGSLDNSGGVTAEYHGATVSFDDFSVTNESGATIDARPYGNITFTDTGITNDAGATIESDGTGASLVFLDDEVTNTGTISADGTVSFDDTTVTNSGGTISVASGAALDLSGATIIGGTITDDGTVEVVGSSTIDGGADLTGGVLIVDSGQMLSLDEVTLDGTAVTDNGTINIDSGDTLTLKGGASISGGAITNDLIEVAGAASLSNDTLTNTGTLQLDAGDTLTLDETTINGGTITANGMIDVTGSSTIDGNAALTGGQVTIENGVTLTLDNVTLANTDLVLESTVGAVYDAAAAFEQGWTTQSNPNGVWSYGYSSGFANPVTLYDTTQLGSPGGAQLWVSPAVEVGESPNAALNDGPAFNNGNLDFLADQFVLTSGIGGQYSDLVFTAPVDGIYSIASTFRGDQYGIGTVVGVLVNGEVLFSSSVTADGQIVPFDAEVSLTAGETVEFSVGPGGGLQNTGLSATITEISSTSILSVDSGDTLTLSGVTIDGGTIDDGTVTSGGIIAATIDVTGDSELSGLSLNYGDVTVESGGR